jgi:uncharacterized membrane protein YccC
MDGSQTMQWLGSFALGAVVAAGAVFAWLSRRMKAEHERVAHVEQARQQMAQQMTQARKQIEQLQRENHELRLAVRPAPRQPPAPAPEPAVDAAEAARRYAEARLAPAAPKERPDGFRETVVLPRSAD